MNKLKATLAALIVALTATGTIAMTPQLGFSQTSEDTWSEDLSPSTNNDVTFECDTSGEHPRTVARFSDGTHDIPIIIWKLEDFPLHPPLVRCEEVSERFREYNATGMLDHLTSGVINDQPVVCVTNVRGGTCQGLLLTLRHQGDDPEEAVQKLLAVRDLGAAAFQHYEESVQYRHGGRLYIDMEEFLALMRRNNTDE